MDWIAASPIPRLPTGIAYLALGVLLLSVHIAFQSILLTRQFGSAYNAGARDEQRKATGVAGRAERALRNFLETFPAFAALALAHAAVPDGGGWWSGFGAALWFWARVAYLPLYLAGVPYLRSLVFLLSAAGLAIMFLTLVL